MVENEISERIVISSHSSISDQSAYSLEAFHNVITNSKLLQQNYNHLGYAVRIKFEDWTASSFNLQNFIRLFSAIKGFNSLHAEQRKNFYHYLTQNKISITPDFDNQVQILQERIS